MKYRQHLTRHWDPDLPLAVWICLNPSTADAAVDDPTTRKIRGFSERHGFGSYLLVNLYPLRATSPRELLAAPVRLRLPMPRTANAVIATAINLVDEPPDGAPAGGAIYFAWGANGNHRTIRERRDLVIAMTAGGHEGRTPCAPVPALRHAARAVVAAGGR